MKIELTDDQVLTICVASKIHGRADHPHVQDLCQWFVNEAIEEKYAKEVGKESAAGPHKVMVKAGVDIFEYLKSRSHDQVEYTSKEIEAMIDDMPGHLRIRILWDNAVGTCLGHLAKDRPDLVKKVRTATKRSWLFNF